MTINLKTYTYRKPQPDYRVGELLKRIRYDRYLEQAKKTDGLVTSGYMQVTQTSGGFGWAVSDYIPMAYKYTQEPPFSSGLVGTYTGNSPAANPYQTSGNNVYGPDLPQEIQNFIDADDYTTWQPAIFVPRVIHWHKENNYYYVGCYILVVQINPNCTETDKKLRLHFQFEGEGIPKGD